MNVEEEVILWVTSDLCPPSAPVCEDQSEAHQTAIPVALISRNDEHLVHADVNPIHYEDPKENYTIVEDEICDTKNKKPKRRGLVWNYFIPTTQDRAQCSFCSTDISYKGKSTNNLLRHLRTKHAEITKNEALETKIESCTTEDGSTYYVLSAPVEQLSSPANSNSSFQDDPELFTPFKRRGGVWKFFSTNSKKQAKCKLCLTVISYKGGSTTNLLRHIKSRHAGVKVPHKLIKPSGNSEDVTSQNKRSIQHSLAEIVNECVQSDDECDFTAANQLKFDPDEDDLDGVENIVTLPAMNPGFSHNTESQSDTNEIVRERKKSAFAWKYFSMEMGERAKCNICEILISFKGGSTGNLLRHLKTKHTDIDLTPPVKKEDTNCEETKEEVYFDVIKNEELAKFVQMLNPRYKLCENPVPRLNEKEVPKRLRKRGAAMSYFDVISSDSGTCQLCGVLVNLKNGSKGPFLRHLKGKHPEIDTLLLTSSSDSDVCDSGMNIDNIENIPIEINERENPAKDKVSRKMRKRGLVWNHFVPLGDEKAKCIVCPAVISYKRGSTSNLLRHVKKKHPEIDVHDDNHLKTENVELRLSDEESDEFSKSLVPGRPLRKKLRKRGRVWNYFKPIAKDRAKCCLCSVAVVYPKGSTTNLLRHMKKKHSSIDLSKEKPFNKYLSLPTSSLEREEEATASCSNSLSYRYQPMEWGETSAEGDDVNSPSAAGPTPDPNCSSSNGEKVNAIYRRSEIIFRKHFDKFLNRPVSVTKSRLFDEQLAKMIVKQYCPFTIVESDEFRKFVQRVNPGYSLPSRKTISSRLIPELYEKCTEKVRDDLRLIRHVTVTINGWTLSNSECYIAVTAHFIDDDCVYQSYLLDCFHYEEQYTAETLADAIASILAEWDVGHKVNAMVSDNTANVTAAIRLRAWPHIPCFANMLNLVVQTGLLEVQTTHAKVRVIVEHVKKNPTVARRLAIILKELSLPETKLRPDDPKCWQTTYEMFGQMVACRQGLVQLDAYVESLPMLSDHEWLLLERTRVVLKPFLDITNEVSEKNITISKVIPLSRCIGNYLKKMLAADEFQPQELHLMLSQMMEEITLRFSDVEDNTLLAEATFLDPRFKNQAFINEQSYTNTYHSILQKASTATEEAAAAASAASSAGLPADSSFSDCDIWEEFDSRVNHLTDAQNPEMAAATEIENYLQEALLSRAADPLAWWKERKSLYPRLFDVMKQRLCIAATAISKNFSSGGQLVCEKRNKLSSAKVSMVLFLNHNL